MNINHTMEQVCEKLKKLKQDLKKIKTTTTRAVQEGIEVVRLDGCCAEA